MPVRLQGIVRTAQVSVNTNLVSGVRRMGKPKMTADAGRRAVGLLGVALLTGLGHGCGHDDADCLARIGRKTMARAESVSEPANGRLAAGWQALRGVVPEPGPADRVSLRLRWDKELAGVEITVTAVPDGVELRGKVRNDEQRQRAGELARATLGVENVVDALEVVTADP